MTGVVLLVGGRLLAAVNIVVRGQQVHGRIIGVVHHPVGIHALEMILEVWKK